MKIIVPIPRPRNTVARALRSPLFHKRVIPSKKTYSRKGRQPSSHKNDGGHY